MTIPTEIAIATFFVGLVGWVAVGIGPDPFVVGGGRGRGRGGDGVDPAGTSGKKGWSWFGSYPAGGGGGADDEVSGGGDELSGNNGW